MISNQVLQSTIDGLRSIARVELCVVDVDGKMIGDNLGGAGELHWGGAGLCRFPCRQPGSAGIPVFQGVR